MTEFIRTNQPEPEVPGSFAEFCEQSGLPEGEALEAYVEQLQAYRLAKAAQLGITLEELHTGAVEYS